MGSGVEGIRSLDSLVVGVWQVLNLVQLGAHQGLDGLQADLVESGWGVGLPADIHGVDVVGDLAKSDMVLLVSVELSVDGDCCESQQSNSSDGETSHFVYNKYPGFKYTKSGEVVAQLIIDFGNFFNFCTLKSRPC